MLAQCWDNVTANIENAFGFARQSCDFKMGGGGF